MRYSRLFQVTRRLFSTELRIYGPTGQYAHALFNASNANGVNLKSMSKSLSAWTSLLDKDAQLNTYLSDPTLTGNEKVANLKKHVLPNVAIEPLAKDFIGVLYEDADEDLFGEIMQDFDRLVTDSLGEVQAVVTSATPLSKKKQAEVAAKLKTMVESGRKISMSTVVDPSILGGLIVSVGDKIQDLSVRGAISKLESDLRML